MPDQEPESNNTNNQNVGNDTSRNETVNTKSPQPLVTKEESLLQAAAAEMARERSVTSADASVAQNPQPVIKSPRSGRKHAAVMIGLVILLITGLGIGGFVLFGKKASAPQASESQSQTKSQTAATISWLPDNVAYANRSANADPYSVYLRPAVGGERTDVTKLARDEYVTVSDARGSVVVFGSESTLYVSTNAGKSYSTLFSAASGEAITSIKLSSEAKSVAIATVPDFANQKNGTVYSIDLTGKNKKELFSETSAVYLIGWSTAKNRMAYWQGCYACDGGRTAWKMRDLQKNTSTNLVAAINSKELPYEVSISSDMTTLVYSQPTYDAAITVDGPQAYYSGAPYRVQVTDLQTGKTTTAATIGTAGEKNPNGTDKIRILSVGFLAGTNTPFYAEGTSLYSVSNTKPSKLYEADKAITDVWYASEKTVIASTSSNVEIGDFVLGAFNIAGQKYTQILQGDANTTIFGITTK